MTSHLQIVITLGFSSTNRKDFFLGIKIVNLLFNMTRCAHVAASIEEWEHGPSGANIINILLCCWML